MLDTLGMRRSLSDSFWPVGVIGGKLVCVPLRGGKEHPDAAKRPVTTSLNFRMPIGRGGLHKSGPLEEVYIRAKMALRQKKIMNEVRIVEGEDSDDLQDEYDTLSAKLDKVTIKLFHAACEAGKVERALDLCSRLHVEKSFEIVLQVADRFNFGQLITQVELVRDQVFPPDEELDQEQELEPEHEEYDDAEVIGEEHGNSYHDHDDQSRASFAAEVTPTKKRSSREAGRTGIDAAPLFAQKRARPRAGSATGQEFEEPMSPAARANDNPFASMGANGSSTKKRSPSGLLLSPGVLTPTKPVLSRNSTFGVESRRKTKNQMQLL